MIASTGPAGARPSPEELALLVGELIDSDWPTTEPEREAWFDRHGIVVDEATCSRDEHGSKSWHGRGREDWGRPHTGWHDFEREFVGLHWFLWHAVERARETALDLRSRFVALAGERVQERQNDHGRFSALWEHQGRTIDMYLLGGPVNHPRHQDFIEPPVVQLEVNHAERERRAEAAAMAAHGRRSEDDGELER